MLIIVSSPVSCGVHPPQAGLAESAVVDRVSGFPRGADRSTLLPAGRHSACSPSSSQVALPRLCPRVFSFCHPGDRVRIVGCTSYFPAA